MLARFLTAGKGHWRLKSRASKLKPDRRNRAKKRAGSESLPSQPSGLYVLRQLSTHCGSNGDDGGGNKPVVPRTNRMKVPRNSHSTDMVGSIHTDNSRIRNPDSQFRRKSERQNAARGRKPIHLPPMRLREAFSYNFPFLFVVLRGNGKLLLRISSTLKNTPLPPTN